MVHTAFILNPEWRGTSNLSSYQYLIFKGCVTPDLPCFKTQYRGENHSEFGGGIDETMHFFRINRRRILARDWWLTSIPYEAIEASRGDDRDHLRMPLNTGRPLNKALKS